MNKHQLTVIGFFIFCSCFSSGTVGVAESHEQLHINVSQPVIDEKIENLNNSIKLLEIQQNVIRLQNQIHDE